MPGDHGKVESCVDQVTQEGHDESTAYAICQASINDEKSFGDTELAQTLKSNGADEWVGTVGRLVRSDVESTVIADVVKRALSGGSRQDAQKAMAKSAKIEKVGFEAEMHSQFTVFKAGDDDFVVWGPASVEVVDKEGDKIQAKALQKALPQLLKRARLSLEHSDQLVGRILENFETEEEVEVEIGDNKFVRKEFPTDVLELDDMEPALFVAGEIYNDTRQAQDTRERIKEGELNSYSISGEALVTQKRVTSDGDTYDDIVDIDLSAVTVCEEGMNQKAKFARIAESGEKTASQTAKSDDPVSPAQGQGEAPSVSAVTSLAKSVIDETMTENTKSGDDSEGSFDPDALSKEFKSVLDDKLPDGELATKEDTLSEDDVRSIAQDVYKQEDVAGEEDQTDSGTSDTSDDPTGRPGEEADVSGEEAGTGPQAEPMDGTSKEDDAGDQDDSDSGYSDTDDDATGRPGSETDYPDTQGDAPDSEGEDVSMGKEDAVKELAASIMEFAESYGKDTMMTEAARRASEEDDDEDEHKAPEDEDFEDDEEDVVVDDEPPEEDFEDDPVDDDVVVDEEVPEEDDFEDDEKDMDSGYAAEDLEERLPADVWEVVREYLDDGETMAGDEEMPDEGDEVMAAQKSEDIESAVEKILDGKGLEKAGGAAAPSGDVEKSYDDEQGGSSNGNPALATFYGE